MSSLIYCLIFITSQCWLAIFANPARYDQRQTGDVNVQIDVKNVEVIALVKSDLLDDYMNYDYVYDYADFTLKPVTKPTTKSPPVSSNNSESTTIVSSTKPMLAENLSNSSESSTTSIPLSTLAIEDKKSTTSVLTTGLETTTKESNIAESTSLPVSNNDHQNLTEKNISTMQGINLGSSVGNKRERITKRCKGLDKTGRCLRRRLSILPLAMRVAPELIRSVRKQIAV